MGRGTEFPDSHPDQPREGHGMSITIGLLRRPGGSLVVIGLLFLDSAVAQEPSPRSRVGAPPDRSVSPPPPAPAPPEATGPGRLPAPAPPGSTPLQDGAEDRSLPANPPGILGRLGEVLPLPLPAPGGDGGPPGISPSGGRPRPGSLFDPGATGPGISQGEENFLDGALDPRTGWPFVFLDHFAPRPERVERFWVVNTRGCPQEMGTDPWPCL